MFQRLVLDNEENSPERFVGMLAYVEWKLEILRHPQVSDNVYLESHLETYRERGRELLKNFAVSVAEQELGKLLQDTEIQKELKVLETRLSKNVSQDLKAVESHLVAKTESISQDLQAVESSLTKKIEENGKVSFWRFTIPVWQSIIASVLFSVGLFGIALLVRFLAPDSNPGQLIKFFFASDQYKLCAIDKGKTDGVDTKKCFP
jgi:hypothetical protein